MLLKFKSKKAQTAVEYLILMTAVVAIVLVGFKRFLPSVQQSSNVFFNRAAVGIYDGANPCGDGVKGPFETPESCCVDFGTCGSEPPPPPDPPPPATCADGPQYCLTPSECTNHGYYWYNNACHRDPERNYLYPVPTIVETGIDTSGGYNGTGYTVYDYKISVAEGEFVIRAHAVIGTRANPLDPGDAWVIWTQAFLNGEQVYQNDVNSWPWSWGRTPGTFSLVRMQGTDANYKSSYGVYIAPTSPPGEFYVRGVVVPGILRDEVWIVMDFTGIVRR